MESAPVSEIRAVPKTWMATHIPVQSGCIDSIRIDLYDLNERAAIMEKMFLSLQVADSPLPKRGCRPKKLLQTQSVIPD